MRKVRSGQSWSPPPAADQNAWGEVADYYARNERLGVDGEGNANFWPVKLKNTSGAERRRFEVLAINGAFVLDDVQRTHVWLEGDVESTPQRLFGVIVDPAESDGIVRAQVSGVCPAWMNIENDAHRRGKLDASEDRFTSNNTGPVQIIHKPTGTGEKLCVVNLSNRAEVKLHGFTPVGGIDKATKSGDNITPGSATCDVWVYDWSTSKYVPLENSSSVQVTETVYNEWPDDIAANTWIGFSEDDDGLLTIDNEACEAF